MSSLDANDTPTPSQNYAVCIVESPSADDLFVDRCEGRVLREHLSLQGTPAKYFVAANREKLSEAIAAVAKPMPEHGDVIPVLHISAHGDTTGIGLTDGTSASWSELLEALRILNETLDGRLIVCFSCCEGFSECAAAFRQDKPFAAFVGSKAKPTWSQTAIGFATFYHLLRSGKSLSEAYEGMKAASTHGEFAILNGETVVKMRETVKKLLRTMTPEQLQERMQHVLALKE
jgi:hypothetical protein